jgi:hypothetical protein
MYHIEPPTTPHQLTHEILLRRPSKTQTESNPSLNPKPLAQTDGSGTRGTNRAAFTYWCLLCRGGRRRRRGTGAGTSRPRARPCRWRREAPCPLPQPRLRRCPWERRQSLPPWWSGNPRTGAVGGIGWNGWRQLQTPLPPSGRGARAEDGRSGLWSARCAGVPRRREG